MKPFSKEDFFHVSREVLLLVEQTLKTYYQDPDIFSCLDFVLLNKLKDPYETRVNLFYLAYTLAGGTGYEDLIRAAAAYEIELLSMYNFNLVFDDKGPSELQAKQDSLMIGGVLLQNAAMKLLFDSPFERVKSFSLVNELLKVTTVFHHGEFSDLNRNQFSMEGDVSFSLKEYWRRMYQINAHMYESISRSAVLLAGSHRPFDHTLIKFGRLYGYIIQLVNDIADFVPASLQEGTDEKTPRDAYADIRNRRVTLPFFYFWQTLTIDERKDVLDRFGELVDPRNEELARKMVQSRAIKQAQNVVRAIARKCHLLIRRFPNEFHEPLKEMLVIAYSNRFYKAFKKLQ